MVQFKNGKLSARTTQDKISDIVTEVLSKVSQQDDIKSAILANHNEFQVDEDSYKLVSIISDNDENQIVEICKSRSNLIIGGIFDLNDNIAQIVNVAFVISDSLIQMGQVIKQSLKFPEYCEIDQNPNYFSIGTISHVYGEEFEKYITQDGLICDKSRYIKNIPTLRLGNSPRVQQPQIRVMGNRIPPTVRRNSSSTLIKKEKIYKLYLVKYIR